MQSITIIYKNLFLFISCVLILSNTYVQEQKGKIDLREIIIGKALLYPMNQKEWEQNNFSYLGYYIQLNLKNGKVVELLFSKDTPQKIIEKNSDLISNINSSLIKNEITNLPDGVHIFPMICEMVPIPKIELQNNLEAELEKTIPDSDDGGDERVFVHKPMLVKIYPPKR